MNRERLLRIILRIAGTFEALAFLSAIMPRAWMELGHEWLSMGTMPRGAVVDFMIRQASFCYGLHGLVAWLMASDTNRYHPLIRFTGWSYLIAAPAFVAIELNAGMPWFWMLGDGLGCGSFGIAVLWLSARGDAVAPASLSPLGEGRGEGKK